MQFNTFLKLCFGLILFSCVSRSKNDQSGTQSMEETEAAAIRQRALDNPRLFDCGKLVISYDEKIATENLKKGDPMIPIWFISVPRELGPGPNPNPNHVDFTEATAELKKGIFRAANSLTNTTEVSGMVDRFIKVVLSVHQDTDVFTYALVFSNGAEVRGNLKDCKTSPTREKLQKLLGKNFDNP